MSSIKLAGRTGSRKQRGQGMTEYIIIVALVAISAIGLYSLFGSTLRNEVAAVTNGVAGNTGGVNTGLNNAKQKANTATTDAGQKLGMDNYGNQVSDQ